MIRVPDRTSDEVGAVAYQAGVQLAELSEQRASLEEAYMQSTEGHAEYVSTVDVAASADPANAAHPVDPIHPEGPADPAQEVRNG